MNRTVRIRRARRSGFTLLEILIVVGIIALLAAFVVPNLMGASEKARIQMAEAATNSSNGPISTALNLFKLAMGTYPKELKELSEKPDNDEGNKWAGPYIDVTKLKDPWNEDYQYKFPSSTQGEDKYDLWSKGPNKQDGDDDDITSWKKE